VPAPSGDQQAPQGYQQGTPGYEQTPQGYQQGPPPGYQLGPPPGYQQGPPPGYQSPPKKKKRRVWLWVFLGVVLLFGGCVAILSQGTQSPTGSSPGANTATGSTTSQAVPEGAGMNQPVRDGKFEFVVTKVESGQTKVGNDTFGKTPQGQFVFVHMTVKNIADQAQTFDGSSQKLFDAQGREFSADTGAAIYLDQSQSFLNQINPGNSVNGIVIFDIPKRRQASEG
jgi:hypothetical protein